MNPRRQSSVSAYARIMSTRERSNERRISSCSAAARTASADHQSANARWMAERGAAIVLPDAELTPERMRAETDALLQRREAMATAARALARPDAARDVAGELLQAAGVSNSRERTTSSASVL